MNEPKLYERARLDEAERLVRQLPCRCISLGDGEYVECDRCAWLHATPETADEVRK